MTACRATFVVVALDRDTATDMVAVLTPYGFPTAAAAAAELDWRRQMPGRLGRTPMAVKQLTDPMTKET